MSKDETVYLQHILDCIGRIVEYTAQGKDAFDESHMIQDAVLRNLEVIGEAVKHISAEFRAAHPEVAWSRLAGMRDILIHHYFGVRLETVWNVVEYELPKLQRHVEQLLVE